MDTIKLKKYWKSEEKKSFKGWDFSYLTNRAIEDPLPWSYDSIVRQYLKSNATLLDMGTGGGEYLLTLNHPTQNTFATEAYPPNIDLCMRKLKPLGIDVRHVINDQVLPFNNGMFDIIINRHEFFDINEISRLLKPNGIFITQQVGSLNNKELSTFLINDYKEDTSSEHTLDHYVKAIQSKGFTIHLSEEYFPTLKFFDVGALVYFAKIIEWEFPNFSVDSSFDQLCKLQLILEQKGFIESKEHRFIIVAQKA
jgi:SAM-dependent methyltransferase